MTADFCIAALQEALARFGTPEIFNPTRGAQFTDTDFTDTLSAHGIAIHMDGKGALHRQRVQRAAVALGQVRGRLPAHLRVAGRGAARAGGLLLAVQVARPHQSLEYRTPDAVYFTAPGGGRKQGCVN
jgi:putative transposase